MPVDTSQQLKSSHARVILVIATLYLFAMMLVTATVNKGLFNYRKVHHLNTETSKVYWSVGTDINLFVYQY